MMMQDNVPLFPVNTVEQAQSKVVFFTRRLSEVRVELETERAMLPSSADTIQASILAADRELDTLQAQINQVRAQSKQHKQKIDEWKQWYKAIAPINKSQAWATLNLEISMHSQAIRDCEARISKLETQKLATMSKAEKHRLQWAAFTQGVYDRPMEEDPRWIAVQSALNAAKAALNAARTTARVA